MLRIAAVVAIVALAAYTVNWIIRRKKSIPDYFELCGIAPPRPMDQFDLAQANARPYRPFRWPYHQTMSLMKMHPSFWLEIDASYHVRIEDRGRLFN